MRRLRREGGTTLILVSLMMLLIIALCALTIDINQAYLARQKLNRAADQAALSAGVWLPDQTSATNSASATATQIAKLNGATSLTTTFPAAGQVRVGIQTNATYFFGSLFGLNHKVVGAGGTATSRGGTIAPIGVRDTGFTPTPGKNFTLTLKDLSAGGATLLSTDWVAMSIGGSGKANFITRAENSYNSNYPKGKATTEFAGIGGAGGAADTGIVADVASKNAIFQQASKAPWFDTGVFVYPNLTEGSPRIVMVARVVQPAKGNATVTINRFGSIYIRSYGATTSQITFTWLGDFTATAGNPNRGWFATTGKGLTRLSQ